jgi:hypothetical protein
VCCKRNADGFVDEPNAGTHAEPEFGIEPAHANATNSEFGIEMGVVPTHQSISSENSMTTNPLAPQAAASSTSTIHRTSVATFDGGLRGIKTLDDTGR